MFYKSSQVNWKTHNSSPSNRVRDVLSIEPPDFWELCHCPCH